MKVFNIERDYPTVADAGKNLAQIIRETQNSEKIIKIIHGYGSSGTGGKIKIQVHKSLRKRLMLGEIKAYIPGEAFTGLYGFDETIHTYKDLLKNDSDYKKGNDGITYIIF